MKNRKTLFIALYVAVGLPLLAWPVVFYLSAFLFDAPNPGLVREILRNTIGLLEVAYPILYALGLKLSYDALMKDAPTSKILKPLVLSVASPILIAIGFSLY